jgi:hypothetical protein
MLRQLGRKKKLHELVCRFFKTDEYKTRPSFCEMGGSTNVGFTFLVLVTSQKILGRKNSSQGLCGERLDRKVLRCLRSGRRSPVFCSLDAPLGKASELSKTASKGYAPPAKIKGRTYIEDWGGSRLQGGLPIEVVEGNGAK